MSCDNRCPQTSRCPTLTGHMDLARKRPCWASNCTGPDPAPPQSQRCEDFPDARLRAAFSPSALIGVLFSFEGVRNTHAVYEVCKISQGSQGSVKKNTGKQPAPREKLTAQGRTKSVRMAPTPGENVTQVSCRPGGKINCSGREQKKKRPDWRQGLAKIPHG